MPIIYYPIHPPHPQQDYDVFFRQKCDTFARSSDAVFELSTRFATPWAQSTELNEEQKEVAKKAVFKEMTQICLWGNSTDLSLLINVSCTVLFSWEEGDRLEWEEGKEEGK